METCKALVKEKTNEKEPRIKPSHGISDHSGKKDCLSEECWDDYLLGGDNEIGP